MRRSLQILLILGLGNGSSLRAQFSFWGGYDHYKMGDFNTKLRAEGNDEIVSGWNVGVELKLKKLQLPISNSVELNFPVGGEYLQARSETAHGGTSVRWALPVWGAYVAPSFSVRKSLYFKGGVGYYQIPGSLATLVVTDRNGSLNVSGRALGWFVLLGYDFRCKACKITPFFETGYRQLIFDNVKLQPTGGFPIAPGSVLAQPTNLPQSLDYSGILLRGGVRF